MSGSFQGRAVAHFESRRGPELDGLIRRQGGVPWSAPALSEVPIEPDVAEHAVLERLTSGNFDIVVLLTGLGTRRLLDEAKRRGRLFEATTALTTAITVARGPKPVYELKQHGIKPTHVAPEPNTTQELLDTLSRVSVAGQRVLILSAGEPFPEPITSLRARGAFPIELQLYRWDLGASDAVRLEHTIDELVAGRVSAAMFTTQVQVRHLFDVAARTGRTNRLANALRERTLVGAVGPTTANALRERGVEPDVIPEHAKMGHLVVALAREIDRRSTTTLARPNAPSVFEYVSSVLRGDGVSP